MRRIQSGIGKAALGFCLLILSWSVAGAQGTLSAEDTAGMAALNRCLAQAGNNPRQCIGIVSRDCQTKTPEGSTTPGTAACHQKEAALWDRLLNERYKLTMASTKEGQDELSPELAQESDAMFKLREAQRKWLAFRDAECDRIYAYFIAGTIRSPAAAYCKLELTAERAIALDSGNH